MSLPGAPAQSNREGRDSTTDGLTLQPTELQPQAAGQLSAREQLKDSLRELAEAAPDSARFRANLTLALTTLAARLDRLYEELGL